MKNFVATFLLATALTLTNLRAQEPAPIRETLNFNRGWKFQLGDRPGAEAVAFNDATWEAVGLPHSFSTPYFAAGNAFYVGYGWYRKQFEAPQSWVGKRVFLEFEAAFQDAEIFVNGTRVGGHQGGYTGFSIDITKALKLGGNVVAVRLNNHWNGQLAPRAGEHVFSGGIYRDVWLVVTGPLHVAWYGTFVTTPQVSKQSATVNVKTEIVNNSGAPKQATVRTALLGAGGVQVAAMESAQTVPAGRTVVFDQTSKPVANPKLWSPQTPNLYTVKTTVLDDGKPVDDFTSPLGFRSIKFTADKGFFLNGEHYYFKGANVHQDHAGWGDAVSNAGFGRDVKMVKDAGMDFIRGSHYPHDPAFSEACDRLGMLFWSENCFWGTGGFKDDGYWNCSAYPVKTEDEKPFEESVKASLRDMIRIHRNHPSIIVWSMSNEPFFSDKAVMPKVREFLKQLVAYSHELDPTRPAAIGGCQRGEIDKLGDIAGYNGDGARLPEYLNPGVASVVSEYGSTMVDRPGNYEPGWGELQREKFPWRSGEAIWCGFDHGSIAGRKFGAMGLVDYFRLPKRAWYWYRNEYAKVPPPEWPADGTPAALKLTADKTALRNADGTDDAQLIVTVVDAAGKPLSNSVPVTLTVESGPGEFPTGRSITFAADSDIAIRDGQAAIEFRSYYAGKAVIHATSPGLKDAKIEINSLGGPQFIAGETPAAKPRPYVRFTGSAAADAPTTYGRTNPTRTSTEAPGHNGSMANDGNVATFWQAANAMPNGWWQVDLERVVAIGKVAFTFPEEGGWRYRVEVSAEGRHWKPAVDQTRSTATNKSRTDTAAPGAVGRFVRVTFTGMPAGKPAAISEFTATGRLAQ
jgi:beta-galactosidase